MKKFLKIACVALAFAMILPLAGCGSSSSSDENHYTIATDTTFAPFEFEDKDGKRVGIDVELLQAIADKEGFTYDLQALGFDAAVSALESGQVDGVIAGMSITDERKQKFDFSEPYFDSGIMCGVKSDSDITSYDQLSGKNVAVKTGTEGASYAQSIADQYGFTITQFQDSANMYEEVKSGNSVACFEDYPVLGYAISQGQPLKMIGELQRGNSYGFAVKKGDEKGAKLLEMFNKGLEAVKEDGTYQKIMDEYISK
ncbi:MAG: transporter substrate-binding domain-containing protein [Eubacteriaceae bacterium]|jgi:glutamine transport system permease protein